MDIQEFEKLAHQEYIDHESGARYMLDWVESNDDDGEDFYTIQTPSDNPDEYADEYLGITPDNGNNVAMMAWEYNAVPVKG